MRLIRRSVSRSRSRKKRPESPWNQGFPSSVRPTSAIPVLPNNRVQSSSLALLVVNLKFTLLVLHLT